MAAMGALASSALVLDAACSPAGASRAILSSLGSVTGTQWLLVLLSCVASGVLGSSLQFRAQKTLPAASAQPFFGLQPLFACAWTALFLSEPIAPMQVAAGGLILTGALVALTDTSTITASRERVAPPPAPSMDAERVGAHQGVHSHRWQEIRSWQPDTTESEVLATV